MLLAAIRFVFIFININLNTIIPFYQQQTLEENSRLLGYYSSGLCKLSQSQPNSKWVAVIIWER